MRTSSPPCVTAMRALLSPKAGRRCNPSPSPTAVWTAETYVGNPRRIRRIATEDTTVAVLSRGGSPVHRRHTSTNGQAEEIVGIASTGPTEKRAVALVAIALALAVAGAILGLRLLTA